MFSNRFAFAALALACVSAAAGGAYLATRQNAASVATVATTAPISTPAPTAKPVQETEAVVGDAPRTNLPAEAPASKPAERPAAPTAAPKREAASRPAPRPERPATTRTAENTQIPTLDRSWPSGSASTTSVPTTPATAPAPEPPPAIAQVEEHAQEPPRAPEPPQKQFEELVVAANSVIGLQAETNVSSETAHVEDRVEAHVSRDVRVGNTVVIPAGTHALGSVTVVERGGKFKERARLGIRFHTLVLADGTRLPINTEAFFRNGEAPGQQSAAKIGGGAVVGAILGAIAGGAKGATIGATTGAGAGTAVVAAGDRSQATLHSGEEVTTRVLSPVAVTVEK